MRLASLPPLVFALLTLAGSLFAAPAMAQPSYQFRQHTPGLHVQAPGGPAAQLSTASLDFGSVALGQSAT